MIMTIFVFKCIGARELGVGSSVDVYRAFIWMDGN